MNINLMKEAVEFSKLQSKIFHNNLYGITDGKKVGTYIEKLFQKFLEDKYGYLGTGNSAKGIDLPGLNTDIKATSIVQPQSSCPYRNARQKIFGLGYNLIVFVYEKKDYIDNDQRLCKINFKYITFIEKHRTADYTTTQMLINMKNAGANKEDIVSYLNDRGIPGDEIEHNMIAEEILKKPFEQGYLTVSNALQWRLQYKRVIELNNQIEGVYNYVR